MIIGGLVIVPFQKIFIYLFIYLSVLGLICSTQDLPSVLQHAGSL